MKKLTITTEDDGRCSVTFDEGKISWEDAVLMLGSTLNHYAESAIRVATDRFLEVYPDADKDETEHLIRIDVADQLNFCFSNILSNICPKDPDLELSEVAIATCENIIIHYAQEHNLELKDALKEVEEILSQYIYAAKPIGENGDKMACGKKKKCKGGKGGC